MLEKETRPNIVYLFNPKEQRYARHVPVSIINAGGNPIPLDYYDFGTPATLDEQNMRLVIQEQVSAGAKLNELLINKKKRAEIIKEARYRTDQALKQQLRDWMKKEKISGIVFPGDFFNYDVAPLHPQPKLRPRFTKALLEIAKEEKTLPLTGFCGGLQGGMAAEGIKLKRVKEMVGESNAHTHSLSDQGADDDANFLTRNSRRQKVEPGTRLYTLAVEQQQADHNNDPSIQDDGNVYILIPEAHGGAFDHTDPENVINLYNKNYRITARSVDGVVQGIEHRSLPINFFQGHPEGLAAIKETVSLSIMKKLLIEPAKNYAREHYAAQNATLDQQTQRGFVEMLQSQTANGRAAAAA